MARHKKSQLLALVGAGSALLLLLSIVWNRHLRRAAPPALPAAPDAGASDLVEPPNRRCSPGYYTARLKIDLAKYKLPPISVETLQQPLRGGPEFSGARVLKGKHDVLDTPHLRIVGSIEKVSSSAGGGQGFRAEHLVLSITNKSAAPLAYRVLTEVEDPERCQLKAPLAHNAIVLRPHETLRRTECLYTGQHVKVLEVDAYEVTALGYRYLSRLAPEPSGPFDMRIAADHDGGGLPGCRVRPWLGLGGTARQLWHKVIDFQARHDCDEYSLPLSYKPWQKPGTLPACLENAQRELPESL